MKFKIDENLPSEIAEMLRMKGYDAMTVEEEKLGGTNDQIIAKVCIEENRALISLDTDFSDIRTYPPREYHGIIVMRLMKQDKQYVLNVFERVINILKTESLEKNLWIVDEQHIRIRE